MGGTNEESGQGKTSGANGPIAELDEVPCEWKDGEVREFSNKENNIS